MTPTTEQNEALSGAFEIINLQLFGGALNHPMIIFTRNSQSIGGYFSPDKWRNEDGEKVHEIAMNANTMKDDIVDLMDTFIHECVHLWQHDNGKPGRGGYHNKQWADKCREVGLEPKDLKTGKDTGDSITTTLVESGRAEQCIAEMPEDVILPWMADPMQVPEQQPPGTPPPQGEEKPKKKGRAKYSCPVCFLNAWAKPNALILCGECNQRLIEES
jgi:hypothetical protein